MKNQKLSEPNSAPASAVGLDRRQFLKLMGSGIIISFVPVFPGLVSEALSAEAHASYRRISTLS